MANSDLDLEKELEEIKTTKKKKSYIKPEIHSEKLMTFGAICNGTQVKGRKSSTGAPNFCNAQRLSS